MAPKLSILMVSGISLALGLAMLSISGAAMKLLKPWLDNCHTFISPPIPEVEKSKICEYYEYWMVAAAVGVGAGIIQILSFCLGWLEKTKTWCVVQVLICVLSAGSFWIAVDHYGFKHFYPDEFAALTVMSLVDIVCSVGGAVCMYFLGRK